MKIKAFTLLEALIAAAIFSLIFAATFEILTSNRISFNIGSTKQDIENQARQGLENMVGELYQTNAEHLNLTAGNTTVTFQVPVGYDNTTLLWGAPENNTDWRIKYSLNATSRQLTREILNSSNATQSTRVMANYVENVTFSLPANSDLLTINLTTQKTSLDNRTLSQNLTSSVFFRN